MSFLDTLRAHGITFHRSNADQNEITICCPFCEFRSQTEDKRFRLGINIWNKKGHCFNCEWKSKDALKEVSDALTLGYQEVGTGEEQTAEVIKEIEPSLPEDFVYLIRRPKGVLYNRAWTYMRHDRGVKERQIEENKIGVSFVGQYAYRIVMPVYHNKKLQGLVTRDFTGQQEPPYLNTPGMKSLYGKPNRTGVKAVLCEGAFDRFAIEQIVPPEYDVMAVLGRSLTEMQEEQLKSYRDIILWPDNDATGVGVKGFLDVATKLNAGHRVFMVYPFGFGKDAGSTDRPDRRYVWATRSRFNDELELKMRNEVAFKE